MPVWRQQWQRLRDGDWRTPPVAAAAALLAAFVVAGLLALLYVTDAPGDAVSEEFNRVDGFRWPRTLCTAVALAFWSPLVVESESSEVWGGFASVAVAPLTITLASLGVLYVVQRRGVRTGGSALGNALRASVPFAIAVGVLAVVGRFDRLGSGVTFGASVPDAVFWSCVAATLTGLVAYRDLWPPLPALPSDWTLAARGALAGLGTGFALSAAAVLVLMLAYRERLGGWSGLGTALPSTVGVLPNTATSLFSLAAGGRYGLSVGPTEYVALYRLHDLSRWNLLLALVPVVAVALAVRYVARRRGERTDAEVVRVCALMGAVAGPVWWLTGVAGRVRLSADIFDLPARVSAGASLMWGTVAVSVVFAIGGWLLGRLAVRRYPAGTDVTRAPRARRERESYDLLVGLAALAVIVAGLGPVVAE